MAGGERQVVELLENESGKHINQSLLGGEEKPETQKRTLYNFIFHPYVVGKNLFTIEKFGLVQYVCQKEKKVPYLRCCTRYLHTNIIVLHR